jgi:hypothetical protein
MKRLLLHVLLPSLASAALIALYFTPKATFGCRNRGLMALCVVAASALAAVAAAVKSKQAQQRRSPDHAWWTLTLLLLILPLALLIGPLR